MTRPKRKYKYDGPVYQFDKYIGTWEGITMAVSEAQALNNLTYRYKSLNHLGAGSAIRLDKSCIYEVDENTGEMTQYRQLTFEDLWRVWHGIIFQRERCITWDLSCIW